MLPRTIRTATPPVQNLPLIARQSLPSRSSRPRGLRQPVLRGSSGIALTLKLASPKSTLSSHQVSLARSAVIARHLSSSSPSTPPNNITAQTNMASTSPYKVRKIAAPNTLEHRIYIEKDGVPISPFHDIPLYANEQQTILNMIVEIPRWTNGKLEVCGPWM